MSLGFHDSIRSHGEEVDGENGMLAGLEYEGIGVKSIPEKCVKKERKYAVLNSTGLVQGCLEWDT